MPPGPERRSTETSGLSPTGSIGRCSAGRGLTARFTDDGAEDTSDEFIERIPDSRNAYKSLEDRQQLEQAAEVLSEREKFVINAIYFRELSQKELAAEMNITVQRVSQIRLKALKKLKKRLEGMPEY